MAQTQFIIDEKSTDSHLTGTVTTTTDRQLMFTSIPYDEGWNIYVDGKKAETLEANNALVSFYVEGEGEHTLEMKYMPTTIALGITISVTCAFIFLVILILYPFIKKVPVLRKLIMIDRKPIPEIASPEFMTEIVPGDIGATDEDAPPASILTEAEASKYGMLRKSVAEDEKKAPVKKPTSPYGKSAEGKKSADKPRDPKNPTGGKK